jgi:hypothetical protein
MDGWWWFTDAVTVVVASSYWVPVMVGVLLMPSRCHSEAIVVVMTVVC